MKVTEGITFKEAFEIILPKRIEKISADESDEENCESSAEVHDTISLHPKDETGITVIPQKSVDETEAI